MASEEDNFDIDIYGDGGEDYSQDATQDEIKTNNEPSQQINQDVDVTADTATNPVSTPNPDDTQIKQENGPAASDVAQKITSTDQSAPDLLHLPKQAPQAQGLKRKDGADDRPIDPLATSALFVSELSWWINDDDIRGWANQSQCEDEVEEITFSEHKVNGKSKGQAYVLFKSLQAATATKQKIESFGEGQYSTKKFTVSYTNPYTNPFKTLPKDGPMRNSTANSNRGAYGTAGSGQSTGYNNYRGNRGGGFNNRGGGMNSTTNFHRGGFQQPMSNGYQGSGMGGYQGSPIGGMQSYGGFQGRGGMTGGMRGGPMGMRGGRGGMNPNPMMGMPMGGMGMGAMGAMGMNMPQMGGGMGMQGMKRSCIQPPVNQATGHGSSASPAGRSIFSTSRISQHASHGPASRPSPGSTPWT
ncbi:hypothetical protein ACLMJK_009003 [Lecanora helva]